MGAGNQSAFFPTRSSFPRASVTAPLPLTKFSPTHQDEPQEPQEAKQVSPEDTETDELWASLEAAAKRKLPDSEPPPGAVQTKRRKKQRPGSTST